MTRFKIWGIRRLLTILPVLLLSQLETALTKAAAVHNSTDSTALKCLLRRVPPQPCVKLTGYHLPGRFLEMYANMNKEMKEGIRNGILDMVAPEDFSKLPVPLFLLLSSQRLRRVSGTALAAMLGHHQKDLSVTVKIMGTLNPSLFEDFFKKLEGVHLSSDSQDKIAETLVRWLPDVINDWSFKKFRMIQNVGSPLLAHLPPYFLANLSTPDATRFLFHLRNWLWSTLPSDMWGEKSEATKRAWTDMMLRSSYPFNLSEWKESEGRRFRYLLEGATPDELKYLNAEQLQSSKLFKTKLSRLQVRTLFDILYSSGDLITANLTEDQLLPVALQLSPTNLLRFNVSLTDFRVLKSVVTEENYCSFSTAKQILESLIVQSVLSGRLQSIKPETWSNGIENLGKFIYVLPESAFESYRASPPSALVQSKIDSEKLSARQARLLTGGNVLNMQKPDLMLGLKGLLKALSTSQLVAAGTLPQYLLYHLLHHLPSGMHMQAVALLQKVEKIGGHSTILQKILSNDDPSQFFQNLPSRTIKGIKSDLAKLKEFNTAIERLPQNTLSVLLTAARTKLTNHDRLWSSDTLLSEGPKSALLGLSCNDIYAMENVDFVYIMEQYNDARKALKKPFPKDLQYCSQMALMTYLEMKASLQDITYSQELLDYLEPAEIEAVGGYILANLPPQDIEKSIHSKNILEAIGQLPLQELLVATKETTPHIYAQLLLKKFKNTSLGAQELFSLGNLAYFLSASDIQKIDPVVFKLFIESSSEPKTLCADSTTRRAWYRVIQTAFGEPFNWTAGTLTILGDFLMVVPRDDLNSVPEGSWKDAADTLTEKTSYHKRIEWPGKVYSIPFYQACAEILQGSEVSSFVAAVKGLTRWYLAAVQMQLSTVIDATKLLAMVQQLKKGKAERKMVMPKIPVEIEHPRTLVQVLEPDDIEKAVGAQRPGVEVELTTGQYDETSIDLTTLKITEKMEDNLSTIRPLDHTAISLSTFTEVYELYYSEKSVLPEEPPSRVNIEVLVDNSSEPNIGTEPIEITSVAGIYKNNTTAISMFEELGVTTVSYNKVTSQRTEQVSVQSDKNSSLTSELNNFGNALSIGTSTERLSFSDMQSVTTKPLTIGNNISAADNLSTISSTMVWNEFIETNESTTESTSEVLAQNSFKFFEDTGNKSTSSEKNILSLDNFSVSLQEKDFDTSIINKQDEAFGSEFENKKFRRGTSEEDFDVQGDENSKVQHSGEILREVLRKNNLVPKIQTSMGTTISPETEITIEPTEKIETTKLWEKVTCDAIKAAGIVAELALNVNDIEEMDVEELNLCVDTLGMLQLDDDVQKKIWSLVNKDKLFENLSDLGYLVKNIDVEDISKVDMNLSSPRALDNIAILSKMVNDNHVLNEAGSHFVKSNPDIKTISTETTVALGKILCEVIIVSSHKLHFMLPPSVFLKASPALGRIKDCPTHCLHKLVNLATKPSEYGPLGSWTAEDVASLGVIPAGLKPEQWRLLSATGYGNNPLVGLSPSAVKCIPPQIFKELDDDQLKSLPSMSAAVVSNEQLSHLSESQQIALIRVQKEVPVWKPSPNIVQSTEVIDIEGTGTASLTKSSLLVIVVLAVISRFSS